MNADSVVASVFKYDEEQGWTQVREMFTARKYHSVTPLDLDVDVDGENICVFPAETTDYNFNLFKSFKTSFLRVWRMILGI